ncbi:MAG TPA: nickel-binding protein [Sporichthyaceae bacterium]|nr:nickel-binding protein [Sporichthyaceae bacterium]
MKYFIDTHDRTKGSFPAQEVTQEQFVAMYRGFEQALQAEGGFATGAHLNLADGKAYCLTAAENEEAVFTAHHNVGLPYDSITHVHRVTGMDLR